MRVGAGLDTVLDGSATEGTGGNDTGVGGGTDAGGTGWTSDIAVDIMSNV